MKTLSQLLKQILKNSSDFLSNTSLPTYNIRICTNNLFTENKKNDNVHPSTSTKMVTLTPKVNYKRTLSSLAKLVT